MDFIDVLIVDDSALMRNLISKIIDNTEGLRVADRAMNGMFALQKLERVDPDVILLDIEMPEMNGLQFLEEIKKRNIDIPVIVLSGVAKEGAQVTMQCLELGAKDFITKPTTGMSGGLQEVAAQISEVVYAYGHQYCKSREQRGLIKKERRQPSPYSYQNDSVSEMLKARREVVAAAPPARIREPGKIEIIAIGVSTGGPNALREVFAQLPADLAQPIVVVQHMPAGFTNEFAQSLNRICPLEVKEAADGDLIKPGRILIAPGGKHLTVEKRSLATIARINEDGPCNGHRPSVEILFNSVAKEFKNNALGIIMTGMGKDGAKALTDLYAEGSRTLGQDEESCVVYGMPRAAYEMGGVEKQISLSEMAEVLSTYGKEYC